MKCSREFREALEAAERERRTFEEIKSALEAFDPTAQDSHEFYNTKVLTWLPPMKDGEIDQLSPLIKEKLKVGHRALLSDIRKMRRAVLEGATENGHSPAPEAGPPPREVHVALRELEELIRKFIALPDPALAVLIAFWILNTYLFSRFSYCGYLALRS